MLQVGDANRTPSGVSFNMTTLPVTIHYARRQGIGGMRLLLGAPVLADHGDQQQPIFQCDPAKPFMKIAMEVMAVTKHNQEAPCDGKSPGGQDAQENQRDQVPRM